MAGNIFSHPYEACYAALLRLYPRSFRVQFGGQMAQVFRDLLREHGDARWRLFFFALWVYCETLLAIFRENAIRMRQLGKTAGRVAVGALAVWMAPLIASQFVEDWHWGARGFVGVYVLLFLVGMMIALIARRMSMWSYKAAISVALVASLGLGWSTMVQTADSGHPERLWYLSVLVVGFIGAGLARLKASGLALTLFAMAAVLALISIVLPSGAPPDMALRMAIGHGVLTAIFTASGVLFRRAGVVGSR